MKISREDVLRVAALAHLDFSEPELETMRRQLDSILTYIEKLNELDTATVEPLAQVIVGGQANPSLREDSPLPLAASARGEASDVAARILKQAPEAAPPFFRVPKVIER
jgi:aspartyl-tRNA(Asn)/glutamyl-tRNA(Gln) amidotransferase subunit C